MKAFKIGIIGAGNLACHLARALQESQEICWIYNRSISPAKSLGEKLNIHYTNKLESLQKDLDFVIVAIKDDAILPFYEKLTDWSDFTGVFLHTSGSVPSGNDRVPFKNYGVFYPLQTFSKDKTIQFHQVPICITASHADHVQKVKELALSISERVIEVSDQQRFVLHLSAVFACNFSNHMYRIAEELLQKESLNFDLLRPLIRETAGKIEDLLPSQSQTGPASREDLETMRKHIHFLKSEAHWQELYRKISSDIQSWKKQSD